MPHSAPTQPPHRWHGVGAGTEPPGPQIQPPALGPSNTLVTQKDGAPLRSGSPVGSTMGSALPLAPGPESRPAQAGPLHWGRRLVKLKYIQGVWEWLGPWDTDPGLHRGRGVSWHGA